MRERGRFEDSCTFIELGDPIVELARRAATWAYKMNAVLVVNVALFFLSLSLISFCLLQR